MRTRLAVIARQRTTWILAGILLLALALRLWGIGFGLPYPYHFDEKAYTGAALNLGAGIIGRQTFPTGFSHLLFPQFAAFFVIGKLTGAFASTAAFEQLYRTDPTIFLLLGRLTTVLLGVLTCLVLYGLGKGLRNRAAGLLAALFLAVAFLHVRDSHYAVPDVAMPFFASLAVLGCLWALHRRSPRLFNLAAAAAGFAVATKWTGWPILLPLALTAWFLWGAWPEWSGRTRLARWLLVPGLCLVAGFVAGGFELLLKPGAYLGYALKEVAYGEGGGYTIWQVDTLPGWAFYIKTLITGLGIVLLALAAGGFCWLIWRGVVRRERPALLLLSFPVVYYLFMGASRHYFGRYALPLVPFAVLCAAELVAALAGWVRGRRPRLATAFAAALVVAAIAQPLACSVRHDLLLTRTDTRTLAKAWIEANIPEGARIVLEWNTHGPPLATAEKPLVGSGRIYDVAIREGEGLSMSSIATYREWGYDYVIASSFIYDIPLLDPARNAARQAYYRSLDQDLPLVAAFSPYPDGQERPFVFDEMYGPFASLWQRERPGPTLRIYRIR